MIKEKKHISINEQLQTDAFSPFLARVHIQNAKINNHDNNIIDQSL